MVELADHRLHSGPSGDNGLLLGRDSGFLARNEWGENWPSSILKPPHPAVVAIFFAYLFSYLPVANIAGAFDISEVAMAA